jgi:hypothetical protein
VVNHGDSEHSKLTFNRMEEDNDKNCSKIT